MMTRDLPSVPEDDLDRMYKFSPNTLSKIPHHPGTQYYSFHSDTEEGAPVVDQQAKRDTTLQKRDTDYINERQAIEENATKRSRQTNPVASADSVGAKGPSSQSSPCTGFAGATDESNFSKLLVN